MYLQQKCIFYTIYRIKNAEIAGLRYFKICSQWSFLFNWLNFLFRQFISIYILSKYQFFLIIPAFIIIIYSLMSHQFSILKLNILFMKIDVLVHSLNWKILWIFCILERVRVIVSLIFLLLKILPVFCYNLIYWLNNKRKLYSLL